MIWINRIIIKKYFSLQYHKCCLQAIDMVGRISGRRDYFDINYEYGLEKSNWLSKTIKELYKLIINKKLTLHAACFSLYSKKLGGGGGVGGEEFQLIHIVWSNPWQKKLIDCIITFVTWHKCTFQTRNNTRTRFPISSSITTTDFKSFQIYWDDKRISSMMSSWLSLDQVTNSRPYTKWGPDLKS